MAGADVEGQNQMAEGNWESKYKLAKLKMALCAVILFIAAILLFAAGTNIALWQKQDQLTNENECLQKQVDELTEKLVEFQAKFNDSIEQQQKERNSSMNGQLVEVEGENVKKAQTILEEQTSIGVPNMVNIKENYNRQKMLSLIKHGNSITSRIYYINWYYRLVDSGFVESIVDLLATTEEPAKMVREVVIEDYYAWFNWPQNSELKLKRMTSNVDIKLGVASDGSGTFLDMAEYELANGECHFQVLIYYWRKEDFNRSFVKFIYRRLP